MILKSNFLLNQETKLRDNKSTAAQKKKPSGQNLVHTTVRAAVQASVMYVEAYFFP